MSESHISEFESTFDEQFGPGAKLNPVSVVDAKQLELSLPDVTITVNPQRSNLVQTRVIDGARYIVIRADEGVEVNGVSIHIATE